MRLRALPWIGLVACNAITGASELDATDDVAIAPPDRPPSSSSSSSGGTVDADVDVYAPPPAGWSYRRAVSLVSDAPAPLAERAVLVTLPDGFDAGHARPSGDDLRFRVPGGASDLPLFIEAWPEAGAKTVWVKVPLVPPGTSTLFLYYGNPTAGPSSDFAATFPRVMRTAGNGAGSFTAAADIDVDWFELAAGDTLTLGAGKPLRITASRVVIAGTIDGAGRGHAGGAAAATPGAGPGGGQPLASCGAGGGAYGGVGGAGGNDTADTPGGAGGSAYGTPSGDDIEMGSGGGATSKAGGAGGGAIVIDGWVTTLTGTIRMNGVEGLGGATGQSGGGGAGGGILVSGMHVDLDGATLEAKGGGGGPTTGTAADGGGGGGGGRIKLRRRANGSYRAPASMHVEAGGAGTGGGTTAPGHPGSPGTTSVNEASTLAKGVETSLGPEERI